MTKVRRCPLCGKEFYMYKMYVVNQNLCLTCREKGVKDSRRVNPEVNKQNQGTTR